MDTRFWGPSGWRLLHLIAHTYTYRAEHAVLYAAFFETLPYILPCKFCRASLTDYYRQHPFPLGMSPQWDLPRWMYTIHNCVNDKLRAQGLQPAPNPTFPKVKQAYDLLVSVPWKQQLTLFWDFLFSVGYHHPKERQLYATPMPECPPSVKRSANPCERNKWNVLPRKERIAWFERFWSLLPAVLPPALAPHWRQAQELHPPTLQTRERTLHWLWNMRCALDTSYHDPYHTICKRIAHHSSDCSTQKGVFTCRRSQQSQRSQRKREKKTLKRKPIRTEKDSRSR